MQNFLLHPLKPRPA